MPDSRGRRSRGVLAESQAIEAAQVMPAALPCSARGEVEHDGVRGEREGERRDRQQRRAGERHAAAAEARREEAREQPDDRRRQRIGGQHEARARLGEVEAVRIARQQRHDRLVERRLDEHRQADRDRDAARVHGSILPARAVAACGGPRPDGQSSTMWMHTHSIIRRRDARAGSSRTTTLRFGAQAPLRPLPQRERPERNPPATCLRAAPTARLHGVDGAPPAGPGRPTCSRQYSPYWDSSSGLRSPPSCMRSRGGSAEALRSRGGARAGERPPRGRRGAQGGGGRRQGAHARRPQRGRGAAQGPQPRGRPLRGAARRPRGAARPGRRRRRGARGSPRRARRGADASERRASGSSWRSRSASSSASRR